MTVSLLTTPLHAWHVEHGGRMVDFAGWHMPVQYKSIVTEHIATRTGVGLFDISHMGRLRFDGPDALPLLDRLLTRNVAALKSGQVRYSLVTNEAGGILDDVLIYLMQDGAGGSYYLLVVNASNRTKIVNWVAQHQGGFSQVSMTDLTMPWAMIAVQGPQALALLQSMVDVELTKMKYYTAQEATILGKGGIVSRTGYTGEDGCEIMVGATTAVAVWDTLLARGANANAMAAGLGCRDTLRLEAAMPLYGHELSEEINPFQAGLGFAVDLAKPDFLGKKALVGASQNTTLPVRIGLVLEGKRVGREGSEILLRGESIGRITSGTFSPTLEKPIAMGYVRHGTVDPGSQVDVSIRDHLSSGQVVPLPFYKRT